MVQLLDTSNEQICGGVLLSDRYILSAVHCYIDTFSNYVVIGVTFRRTLANIRETISLRQKISSQPLFHRRHERFISSEISITIYDLMLLILETPLKNYCSQNFARLPNKDFWINQKLILNGWGSTHEVTHEEIIAFNKGELDFIKTSYPLKLRQISLAYVPYHVCQKRFQDFLDRHQKTKGRKTLIVNGKLKNGKYTGHTLKWIKFGTGLGLSMICTSSCPAEDLRQCPHQHESWESGCFGDSGCKFLGKISNANVIIFYFDILLL